MTPFPIRDVSLFVKVIGQGYPILMMHGGPGADHTTLSHLEPLSDQFTLVFYDHRCNGRSVGPDVSTMTWENLTADADALRRTLGFEQWAVLGHSFGGMVALEYALRYPQSVSHLLLMDTCGDTYWVQYHAPALLEERGYSPAAVQAARRFFNGELEPDQVMPAMLRFGRAYYHQPKLLWMVRELASDMRVKMRPEALIYGFGQLLKGWSVMDRLGEIHVPTLVLAGRHDFQFPPEHQIILAAGIPHAQLEIIELAGHNAPMERPAEVMDLVRRFLAQEHPVAC